MFPSVPRENTEINMAGFFLKIDGRRIVVDVERGRTVPGWMPRRLGGGKGQTRKGAKKDCITTAGRDRSPGKEEKSETQKLKFGALL